MAANKFWPAGKKYAKGQLSDQPADEQLSAGASAQAAPEPGPKCQLDAPDNEPIAALQSTSDG